MVWLKKQAMEPLFTHTFLLFLPRV